MKKKTTPKNYLEPYAPRLMENKDKDEVKFFVIELLNEKYNEKDSFFEIFKGQFPALSKEESIEKVLIKIDVSEALIRDVNIIIKDKRTNEAAAFLLMPKLNQELGIVHREESSKKGQETVRGMIDNVVKNLTINE